MTLIYGENSRGILSHAVMRSSKPSLIAATSAIALAIASPAFAQTAAPAPTPATADTDNTQEVVVTGIRGSLQRNLDIKRSAPGVVDAISSEDIGKFPDSNVASALQRLPGVSIQRSGSRGEATGVTVRGFGGGFNDTLYDGRHISTATGGRDVDFTTVGSDFVGQLNVYKTPDVTLSTSAIGATIDVQLPKPMDRPGFHATLAGSGALQSRDKHAEPSAGVLFSDTFAGDTLGILGDIVYTRHDTTANQVNVAGWVGNHFAPCQKGPENLTCSPTSDPNSAAWADPNNRKSILGWFPQQSNASQINTKDERIDGRLAVQWKPSDSLLLTLDDNFTRQTLHTTTFGYGAWFNGDDLRNVQLDSNGTVVDFNQFGTPMDFNANKTRQILQTNQVGANLKWDATEHLKFDFDAAYAKSVENPNNDGYNDGMDIGYGGTNAAPAGTTPQFVSSGGGVNTVLGADTGLKITGSSSKDLPNIHNVGPAGNVSQYFNTADVGSHVIVRFKNYNKDTVKQARVMGTWSSDNFKLTFGGQYKDDHFYQQNWNTFTNGVFGLYSGYGPASGRTGNSISPLPAGVYQGTISTANFIPGYDSSVLAPGFFRYDPYAVYAALEATGHGSTAPAFDPSSVLGVQEKTYALFMKASFDEEVAGMPLHLNFGLRDEGTHVITNAQAQNLVSLTLNAGDPTVINTNFTSTVQNITGKANYNYLLPSADLKLELTPQLIFRLDASRTLTRPNLADLKPTVNLGSLRRGSLSGSGGNPNLTPYLSDNFDVAVEWYYGRNSYFAVDGFLKDLTNFIVGGVTTRPINNVIDPTTGQIAQFNINAKVNGPNATVRGVEIAWQQVFGDTGFGFQANATLVDTNKKFNTADISGSAFAITGLANSANFVGFYDKHGFQVRVALNWRDTYLLQLGQNQGGTFGAEPVNVDAQTQIDASASYDFNKHVTVFVEGTNLNNSTYSTHGRFSNQTLDVYSYGRRYTAGVRLHF